MALFTAIAYRKIEACRLLISLYMFCFRLAHELKARICNSHPRE